MDGDTIDAIVCSSHTARISQHGSRPRFLQTSFINDVSRMMAHHNIEIEMLVASVTGLLSHWFIFISGEWYLRATSLLKFYLFSYCFIIFGEASLRRVQWQQGLVSSTNICGVYAISLWGSMVIYRLFVHPLHNFPGPVLARTTELWHVARCCNSRNHILMEQMHENYGSFVRTGRVAISLRRTERH